MHSDKRTKQQLREALNILSAKAAELESTVLLHKAYEDRFRSLLESVSEGILMVSIESGEILAVNRAFSDLIGTTQNEFPGKKIWEIDAVANVFPDKEVFHAFLKSSGTLPTRHTLHRKNGTTIFLDMVSTLIPAQNPTEVQLSFYRTKEQAQTSHTIEFINKNQDSFNNHPVPMFLYDAITLHLVDVNKKALDLYGYTRAEFLSKTIMEIHPPEDIPDMLQSPPPQHTAILRKLSVRHARKDGSILYVNLTVHKLSPPEKVSLRLTVVCDITQYLTAIEALKLSEEKYQTIANFTYDWEYWRGADGQYIYVSPSCERITGYKPEDFMNEPELMLLITHPAYNQIISQHLSMRNSEYADPCSFDFCLISKEKKLVWIAHECQSVYSQDGKWLGRRGSNRNITERKQIEEELKITQENFMTAFHNSPVAISIVNFSEGQFLEINERAEQLLEFSRKELIGKFASDLLLFQTPEEKYLLRKTLLRNETLKNRETIIRTKTGKCLTGLLSIQYIQYKNQYCIIAAFTDISDLKKTEQALQRSEELYRKLVDTVAELILLTDMNGNIQFINKERFEPWSSQKTSLFIGQNIISFVRNDERERAERYIKQRMISNIGSIELPIIISGGKEIIFEVNGDVLRRTDGTPYGLVVALHDITERKHSESKIQSYQLHLEDLIKERTDELKNVNLQLQEEIQKQKQSEHLIKEALIKEKELNSLKSKFVSMVSHEYRTPLATISLSAELLERYSDQATKKEKADLFRSMKRSVSYLTDLLDDVISLNRTDLERTPMELKRTDLVSLTKQIMEEVQASHHYAGTVQLICKTNKMFTATNEKLYRRIFGNIFINAVKYSVAGKAITVYIKRNSSSVYCIVKDRGCGISKKDMHHIFAPFFRADNAGNISGSGLGLAIAKRSIERLNGQIMIKSKLNSGTTVTLQMPYI